MPCRGSISLPRSRTGNVEGIRWLGLLEKKGEYIWVPFIDPKCIKILILGPSGTLVKGQESTELISDCGAQRAIRPRCIGSVRART